MQIYTFFLFLANKCHKMLKISVKKTTMFMIYIMTLYKLTSYYNIVLRKNQIFKENTIIRFSHQIEIL